MKTEFKYNFDYTFKKEGLIYTITQTHTTGEVGIIYLTTKDMQKLANDFLKEFARKEVF